MDARHASMDAMASNEWAWHVELGYFFDMWASATEGFVRRFTSWIFVNDCEADHLMFLIGTVQDRVPGKGLQDLPDNVCGPGDIHQALLKK